MAKEVLAGEIRDGDTVLVDAAPVDVAADAGADSAADAGAGSSADTATADVAGGQDGLTVTKANS